MSKFYSKMEIAHSLPSICYQLFLKSGLEESSLKNLKIFQENPDLVYNSLAKSYPKKGQAENFISTFLFDCDGSGMDAFAGLDKIINREECCYALDEFSFQKLNFLL